MVQTRYSKVAQISAMNNMHKWNSYDEEEIGPKDGVGDAKDPDDLLGEDGEEDADGLLSNKISLEDEGGD